jgi:hypothetical protein
MRYQALAVSAAIAVFGSIWVNYTQMHTQHNTAQHTTNEEW